MGSPYFRFQQFTVWHDKCAMKVGTDGVLLGAWATPLSSADDGAGSGSQNSPFSENDCKTVVYSEETCKPSASAENHNETKVFAEDGYKNATFIEKDCENALREPRCMPMRILDVGTGSGLVALMLAQRFPKAQIDAIDIDEGAYLQATDNFQHAPFADRLCAHKCSLQEWNAAPYDMIVSNPPYFANSLLCPNKQRTGARHNSMLPFADLIKHSERLLSPRGVIALVLPKEVERDILALARLQRLCCNRLTNVYTKEGKPAKRILISFSRVEPPTPPVATDLYLSHDGEARSAEYTKLTEGFYL